MQIQSRNAGAKSRPYRLRNPNPAPVRKKKKKKNRLKARSKMLVSMRHLTMGLWNQRTSQLGRGRYLPVLRLKVIHKCNQIFNSATWTGIIDRRPQAAHVAVPLEPAQTGGLRCGDEPGVEFFGRQTPSDVHQRSRLRLGVPTEEVTAIDRVVEQPGLRTIGLLNRLQTTLRLDPFEHQAHEIHAPRVRRVIERLRLRVDLVVQIRRQRVGGAGQ